MSDASSAPMCTSHGPRTMAAVTAQAAATPTARTRRPRPASLTAANTSGAPPSATMMAVSWWVATTAASTQPDATTAPRSNVRSARSHQAIHATTNVRARVDV